VAYLSILYRRSPVQTVETLSQDLNGVPPTTALLVYQLAQSADVKYTTMENAWWYYFHIKLIPRRRVFPENLIVTKPFYGIHSFTTVSKEPRHCNPS